MTYFSIVYPPTSFVLSAPTVREKRSWASKQDNTNKYICQGRAPLETDTILSAWSCYVRMQIILRFTGGNTWAALKDLGFF